MTDRQKALGEAIASAARAQIGVTEWAEGSNPAVEAYWKAAGMAPQPDDVPWCAAFVGACLGAAGILGTGKPNARSYLGWGTAVDRSDLQPGDLIVSWRGKRDGWQGHVEIVTGRGDYGAVITVGGNEGNAVREAPYDFARFLGARRAPLPREKPRESTTIRATTADALVKGAQGATAVAAALGALDWRVALALIGAGTLIGMVLALTVYRERMAAWAAGWR